MVSMTNKMNTCVKRKLHSATWINYAQEADAHVCLQQVQHILLLHGGEQWAQEGTTGSLCDLQKSILA